MAGVDLEVVTDTFVDHRGLGGGHATDPVAARDLASGCGFRVAAHPDPQDVKACQALAEALLGGTAGQEHVVVDDARPCPGHRGDAGQPGDLGRAEVTADADLALLAERDPGIGVEHRRWQRVDEVVHAQPEPWLGQDGLQAACDPRFPGTGPAVKHDDPSHGK